MDAGRPLRVPGIGQLHTGDSGRREVHGSRCIREATNNPLTRTDDYTLLNARLSLLPNDGRWDVSAYVYNATDEEYFQEAFFSDLIGSVAGLAGAPRTYGLSFTYNLGQ